MKTLQLKKQAAFTKRDLSKFKILFRLLFVGAVVMVLCLFYIWSRVEVLKMGYDIGELQKEQKELKEQSQKLKLEISVLQSPKRIETLATQKLDMVWPSADQVYKVK